MRCAGSLLRALALLAAGFPSACVTVVEEIPAPVAFADLAVPDGAHDLACTVYPRPASAEYGERLLDFRSARFVNTTSTDFRETLERHGLAQDWERLESGYLLAVVEEEGRPVVLSGSRDRAGAAVLGKVLEQLGFAHEGRWAVREARIVDSGGFPLRGSKRLRDWELRYRANLSWGDTELWYEVRGSGSADPAMASLLDYVEAVPYTAPGSPFDATDEAVRRALDRFRRPQDAGARRFAVKFDDVGFELTAATKLAFGGYARALRAFLVRVRDGLRERDPDAVLYYLPQTYWWNDPRLEPFAGALRAAGGLPADIGLVVTGPEVVSETIDAAGLAAAREAFGLTRTPALIYDNLGRDGDWGPLTGREAGLLGGCEAVFGERGTPVNRLTRLDWSWNPTGYDAEWSWRRAIYELAGPVAYPELLEVCRLFRSKGSEPDLLAAIDRFAAAAEGDARLPVPLPQLVDELRADARLPVGE